MGTCYTNYQGVWEEYGRLLKSPLVVNVTDEFVIYLYGTSMSYGGASGIAIVDMKFWEAVKDESLVKNHTWRPLWFDMVEKYNLTAFIMYNFLVEARPWKDKIYHFACYVTRTFPELGEIVLENPMWNRSRAYYYVDGKLVKIYTYDQEFLCKYDMPEYYLGFVIVGEGNKIYIIAIRKAGTKIVNDTEVIVPTYDVMYVLDNVWGDRFTVLLFAESNAVEGYDGRVGFREARIFVVNKDYSNVVVRIGGKNKTIEYSGQAYGSVSEFQYGVDIDETRYEGMESVVETVENKVGNLEEYEEGAVEEYGEVYNVTETAKKSEGVTTIGGLVPVPKEVNRFLSEPIGLIVLIVVLVVIVGVIIRHYKRKKDLALDYLEQLESRENSYGEGG